LSEPAETSSSSLVPSKVTLSEALPPLPVQVSVKVREPVKLPTDSEPEVALLPDQAPLAVHAVACVEVQDNVAVWLQVTEPLEVRSTVGACSQLHLHQPLPQNITPPALAQSCCSVLEGLPDKVSVQMSMSVQEPLTHFWSRSQSVLGPQW